MIYLVRDTGTGHVKLGYSENPITRMEQLQIGSAAKLALIGTIGGDKRQERVWHKYFRAKRVQGEWFALDEADMCRVLASQLTPEHEATKRRLMTENGYATEPTLDALYDAIPGAAAVIMQALKHPMQPDRLDQAVGVLMEAVEILLGVDPSKDG